MFFKVTVTAKLQSPLRVAGGADGDVSEATGFVVVLLVRAATAAEASQIAQAAALCAKTSYGNPLAVLMESGGGGAVEKPAFLSS